MAFWKRETEPDHARYLDLCSQRLDGRLAPGEAQELDRHLADCTSCRLRADELAQVRAITASLTAVPLRRSFTLSRYQVAQARRGRVASTFGRLASVAAVACFLTLSGSFVLPSTPMSAPAAERAFSDAPKAAPIAGDTEDPAPAPLVRQAQAPGETPGGSPERVAPTVALTMPNPVEATRTTAAGLGLLALGLLSGRWLTLRRR